MHSNNLMYKKSTWSYACTCITAGGITKSAQVLTIKREKKNHAEFFLDVLMHILCRKRISEKNRTNQE